MARFTFVLGLLAAAEAGITYQYFNGATCEGEPIEGYCDEDGSKTTCELNQTEAFTNLGKCQDGSIGICTSSGYTHMTYADEECSGQPYSTACDSSTDPPIQENCSSTTTWGECLQGGDVSYRYSGSCDEEFVKEQDENLAQSGADTGDFEPAGDEEAPCFSRDTHTCRVLDAKVAPTAAFSTCFGGGGGRSAEAERVLMSELSAGDYVLSDATTVTRVIVSQHRLAGEGLRSSVVGIAHSSGYVSLTPDHVLLVEGEFAAARSVKVGARLSDGATVTAIKSSVSAIINPLTSSGTILAAGTTGQPVLSSTYPEWMAHHMLSVTTYPLPYSLASGFSYLFPEHVQAYYDAMLEPAFTAATPHLKTLKGSLASSAAVGFVIFLLDLGLSAGFVAYSVASIKGMATLAILAAAALKARRAKA